jgi:hypothetical protein
MAATVNLNLLTLESNQFNPELVYNSNLEELDIIVQLNVISTSLTTPPAAGNGDAYIPAAGSTGDWSTKDNYIAYYYNGWKFITPKIGWRCIDKSNNTFKYWSGSSWTYISMIQSVDSDAFEIKDTSSPTSKLKFNLDDIPTSTTTTLKLPNANYILAKQNIAATAAPTSSDDSADGYSIGSIWIDISADKGYMCVDATAGASVWKEVASATGAGDVLGPASSTTNELVRWADATGDNIKTSSVYITNNKELYPYHKVVDEKVTNYTLIGTDSGKVILINSSSNLTVTLPETSTETIANGFHCRVIRRGTGTTTFVVQGTDTIESKDNDVSISTRYGEVEVTKIVNGTPNVWHLSGDLV